METTFTVTVNGQRRTVTTDPQRRLLDVLREEWQLTGTKYGCGEGSCGACTVLLDGKRASACAIPMAEADQKSVVTIEGLNPPGGLHPVQEAFLEEGAFQCGYCTPGMILTTVALLRERSNPSDIQIVKAMDGNLCRCCGYPKILKAVRNAAARLREVKTP